MGVREFLWVKTYVHKENLNAKATKLKYLKNLQGKGWLDFLLNPCSDDFEWS